MTTIDDLPVFEDIERQLQRLDQGGWATVYRVKARGRGRTDLIAKVMGIVSDDNVVWSPLVSPYSELAIEMLQHEAVINKELYESGISVPEPFGVFAVSAPAVYSPPLVPAFLRELISGKKYSDLPNQREKVHAKMLHQRELDKASSLGYIIPSDHGDTYQNCLFRLEEDKAILFDFGNWKRTRGEYLRWYHI